MRFFLVNRLSRNLLVLSMLMLASICRAEPLVLRSADNNPATYPTAQALAFMAERVAELSNGRMNMKLYTGGQLGDERDTLEITLLGGIDVNRLNMAPLNSIVPETLVLTMPFLFESKQHLRTVLDGEIGEEILASLEPHGLIGLAYYDSGARSIYNTQRPIHHPDDLDGLKIRVQNSELYVAMIEAIGGSPTPMGFNQVYESLILGTIEGSENNWPSYENTGHYEIAPYLSLTEHTMTPEVVVVSKYRWQQLTKTQQHILRQAAKESVPYMREQWDRRVETSKEKVMNSGVKLVENVDKAAFFEATKPVYQKLLTTTKQKDMVERIRQVAREIATNE